MNDNKRRRVCKRCLTSEYSDRHIQRLVKKETEKSLLEVQSIFLSFQNSITDELKKDNKINVHTVELDVELMYRMSIPIVLHEMQ